VILSGILGALALLSLGLTLWQWLAARRFPLHHRQTDKSPTPAVTLLKPVKGADEHTEACLRSWFAQDYAGETQILFAAADAEDAACPILKKLLSEFPECDAQLVICPEQLGTNAKVSKLIQLELLAKHDIFVVSDADVRVPEDLLANVVWPFTSSRPPNRSVGLVNCFYQLANPTTCALRWEAVAINADFWSQVLQSKSLKPLDFALGAVMALRRESLVEIGGFRALADCLADDYQLGHRIAQHGHRIELSPVVVECWSEPMGWGAVWRHQLRWARTIRVCQPVPYFFSILSNATFWPLLWLAVRPSLVSLIAILGLLVFRLIVAEDLTRRLTRRGMGFTNLWLVWVKDLLQVALWASAFAGNRVEWRETQMRLRRDGTVVESQALAGAAEQNQRAIPARPVK
jgi:ceramide glucosyltransferase